MTGTIEDRDSRLRGILDGQIRNSRYPGIQYVVTDSAGLLFEYDGGLADIEGGSPMTPGATMMAYSMTKTFTAVAVLQLVERGQVNLEDSVRSYLDFIPYDGTLTVRHLLAQMSGIANPIPLRWVHAAELHSAFSEDSALSRVLMENPELKFPPGTKYAYSNISYWLLGKIVEKVSGMPFSSYMRQHVFGPLRVPPEEAAFIIVAGTLHAKGYLKKYSWMNILKGFLVDKALIGEYEGSWLNIRDHYLNGPAFGGLITTARVVARFLQDQLKEHSALLSPATMKIFYGQQRTLSGEPVPMTLGWHIGELSGTPYYYKEGGGGGYHSEMRIYPSRHIGTVIMVNETSSGCTDTQDEADAEFLK
ncbi:MAG TPA: serine hydrolase domain-containing protein [Bacteroidota bacterium]|nr:serine hydrolase domain-containing protein [Bacteroidota bacterium]